jgi:hypothetical protein
MTGWWLTYPSEKYEFVSWDDDIPNIWKNISQWEGLSQILWKIKNVRNRQPVMIFHGPMASLSEKSSQRLSGRNSERGRNRKESNDKQSPRSHLMHAKW